VLLNLADIFEFFRGLPLGLIAAAAFLFLAFFVALLWLEVAALVRMMRERSGGNAAFKRICDDLDRLEERTAKLNEKLEGLAPRETQGDDDGNN